MKKGMLLAVIMVMFLTLVPTAPCEDWTECRENCEAQRRACMEVCTGQDTSIACSARCTQSSNDCVRNCDQNNGASSAKPTATTSEEMPQPAKGVSASGPQTPPVAGKYEKESGSGGGDSQRMYQYKKWQECFK